ncbi:MAG: hypothetical protein RQ833_10655 [Sphingomonadaceae bacterium]|nr:hypothetical protein [Sphingomonadaceae bacterium]
MVAAAPARIVIDCAAPSIALPPSEAASALLSGGPADVAGTIPLGSGSAPATAVPGFGAGGFYGLPFVSVAAPPVVATPAPAGGTPGSGANVPPGGGPTIGPPAPTPVASPSAAGLLGVGAMTVLATRFRRG